MNKYSLARYKSKYSKKNEGNEQVDINYCPLTRKKETAYSSSIKIYTIKWS